MRVATYYNNKDIRIEERPVPSIGEGELLIRVRAASICGSDTMEWYRVSKAPCILGHEIAGEIVEVGPGVKDHKKGDRISVSHHVPCYECHYCRLDHHTLCDTLRSTNFDPGGFAELVRLPAINVRYGVYPLADNVSYEEGALVEPLACIVRAQRKASVRPEQTLLVIGSGISGLFHIQLARAHGIHRIVSTDIVDYRLKVAKELGADFTFHASEDIPKRLYEVNEGRLADVVIVCAESKKASEQALKSVGRGGTILFFALASPDQIIPMSMNNIFWQKGVTLMSSYAGSPEDHRESLELIRSRKVPVGKMISHRLAFNEIAKGFELVAGAKDSLKVIVDPTR